MNLTGIEVLIKKATDLQLEVKELIGTDDEKAKKKVLELTELQIEICDAIQAYKNRDNPTLN